MFVRFSFCLVTPVVLCHHLSLGIHCVLDLGPVVGLVLKIVCSSDLIWVFSVISKKVIVASLVIVGYIWEF